MRLLVLNYEYPPLGGGAAPVSRELSELFCRRGHEVDVVTMHYRGLPRTETLGGVRIHRVRTPRKRQATCETHEMLLFVLAALPRVLWRIATARYDLVHVHFVIPTGLLAYLATRFGSVPYVVTAHGSDIPGFNPDRFTAEHRITGPVIRRVLRAAAAITSPSVFLKGLIRKSCGDFEIEHIPNGLVVDGVERTEKRNRVLMTGRLLRRKGFHLVLEALREIETDCEVHIVGDGPYRAELERLASESSVDVLFHGWIDRDSPELKALYDSSRIFCLPSERENASISLLEAMRSGAAVITSDAPGCVETVGDSAMVVPYGDVPALREALRSLLASPERCDELGKRARTRIREYFDWERIADRYLELFRRLGAASGRAQSGVGS